jgi:predicted nucleic acid-binding protein
MQRVGRDDTLAVMRIYFDTCSLQRSLDDKSQLRVALEAEAVLGVLSLCEEGKHSFCSSDILQLENDRNPQAKRKEFTLGILERASEVIEIDDEIGMRAKELEKRGFKAFDAVHVACAEAGKVDYLCTCDDRLLKKAPRQTDLTVKLVSPLELAQELSE